MNCPECGFNAREIGLIEDPGETYQCCSNRCGHVWTVDEQEIISRENKLMEENDNQTSSG